MTMKTSRKRVPPNRRFWHFAPGLIYLNHGSYGAVPRAVLHAQEKLRKQFQGNPTDFVIRQLPNLWARARHDLARFLKADPMGLVFIRNATEGVNTVLASFPLQRGDEILVTSHGYNACTNAVRAIAARSGARVVEAWLPFPCQSAELIAAAVANRLSSRTRLVLLDHITSPSALILPIKQLVEKIEAQGIPVLVDGAHAPGQIPLNLPEIGASFYTGNCHKWLCAPPGAAFLYISEAWRERIRPLVTSHGYNAPAEKRRNRLQIDFDWTGTQDVTPILSVPAALEFMAGLYGNWPALMRANHAKVLAGHDLMCEALELTPPAPRALLGSMASLILPQRVQADKLRVRLLERHNIQTQLFHWAAIDAPVLRLSAQAYNKLADYEKLAAALRKELKN